MDGWITLQLPAPPPCTLLDPPSLLMPVECYNSALSLRTTNSNTLNSWPTEEEFLTKLMMKTRN